MIETIGSSTSVTTSQRAQATAQSSLVRNTDVLNAVQQKQQKSSGATAPVKIFAVPQSSKGGSSSGARLPRGSLLDVLA